MNKNNGKISDRWLDKRGLFQDRDNTIRHGSGNFWGKSDNRGAVRNGSGNYVGRVTTRGGFKR